MAKTRSYRLLCPIARALDRIGDRWTLLILRDLHAGPARFSELQRGLTGIAANLLTERLTKLVADGLVERTGAAHGATVYRLTDLGRRTSGILLDLALFGARFELEVEPVPPGNLRTVATTLGAAAQRVATPDMTFRARLVVDGEPIQLTLRDGQAEALYDGRDDPDIVLTTSYASLLAVTEGEMSAEDFAGKHATIEVLTPGTEAGFQDLIGRIVTLMRDG